jgi:hypothetical protein
MARTALAVQEINRDGLDPAQTAANADGHSVVNDGKRTMVHVLNGGVGSINVTFKTPGAVDGNEVSDRVEAVGAGADKIFGPFPAADYNQSDGTLHVDFSGVTTVTCAAMRLASN